MSESPVSPLPTKEVTTTSNGSNIKKFEGDGVVYKGKLIGMEDLSVDRDEKICLDSMFKLKAVVRARGEHKQKIQLILTMSAVKIIDENTKVQIASHEIERISFVVVDPRDPRAFGYIFNTSNDRHQFWAIKTERTAAPTVLALKELFELAYEQFTNSEKTKEEINKSTITSPISNSEQITPTKEQPSTAPLPSPPPPPPPTSEPIAAPTSLLDDIWGESSTTTLTQPTQSTNVNLLDMNEPSIPIIQPAPKIVDPLEDLFSGLSTTTTTTTQSLPSTNTTNSLFDVFPNTAPPTVNHYSNLFPQPTQPNLLNTTSILPQQQQRSVTPPIIPPPPPQQQRSVTSTIPSHPPPPPPLQQQQQQNFLSTNPFSPVAPQTVTSPFTGLDIFENLSSGTAVRPTKESFFPPAPPVKTIQQLQMEKQRNAFSRT